MIRGTVLRHASRNQRREFESVPELVPHEIGHLGERIGPGNIAVVVDDRRNLVPPHDQALDLGRVPGGFSEALVEILLKQVVDTLHLFRRRFLRFERLPVDRLGIHTHRRNCGNDSHH